ncbi:cupredoxin domain-containing protein [bacterium]|nr:cupredoxin domain-containing protein [bacterium]
MRRGLLIFSILVLTLAALAAIHNVSIGDNFFNPEIITIDPGDRIRWTNNGDYTHRTKSLDDLWDSGFLDPGESYTRTFNDTGSFDYHDPQFPTATGTVVVKTDDVELMSWGRILSLYR